MAVRLFRDGRSWVLLGIALLSLGAVHLTLPDNKELPLSGSREEVIFEVQQAGDAEHELEVRSTGGGALRISLEPEGPLGVANADRIRLPVLGNARRTDRLVCIPTSLKWRRPMPGQPSAMLVRAAAVDELGRMGPERFHTVPIVDHGGLPLLSLLVAESSLFDPDSGIYVVGNAMLHGVHAEGIDYATDTRWWKYPGNYHGRGKEWERPGRMQLLSADGQELFQGPLRLRINGQLTRAFPQHALRLLFDEPLSTTLFANDDGAAGYHALVLRGAGNDQMKAFMRDAFLQRLCAGGRVEVADALSCVVYINGAYWGLHHLRHRMDEREIARRHGLPAKEVVFVEELDGSLSGEWRYIDPLKGLVSQAREGKGGEASFIESMGLQLDLDAFLEYMAIMLYVDNRDWPRTNVKFWRRTGASALEKDGLWRPVIQDLDLAYGAISLPTSDPWAHIRSRNSPMIILFEALMQSPEWKERFRTILLDMLSGRFAEERVILQVDSMAALLAPEMDRHTARWRKPASKAHWLVEVEVLRDFARRRPATLRDLLDQGAPPHP